MTTTATSTDESPPDQVELPPGYYTCPDTGAWLTLPWPGDHVLPWGHPSRLALLPPSLGPAVIRWCEQWLVNPTTGERWRFTPAQKRWLHLWYALTPEGRWVYWSGCKRGAKGVGKDPLAAAMVLAEFAGPVEFAQWGPGGRPLSRARRMALVQIGANSEAQAADLLRLANAMMSKRLRDRLGMTKADLGVKRTVRPGGSRIELLTASEASNEGDPATAVFLNETHHMTDANQGTKLAEVGDRNVSKSPKHIGARLCEFTNAFQQGQDSRAERTYNEWQAQVSGAKRRQGVNLLYDSREADPATKLHDWDSLMRGVEQAYFDAPWSDLERIAMSAQDTRRTPAESIRYYLNGLAAAEDAWADPKNFDAMGRPGVKLKDGDKVALFLDCSKSSDATGLVGCRISDGHVFVLGVWQKPHGDRGKGWIAPRDEVDDAVDEAMEKYKVLWFGVDPSPATDDDTEVLYWKELIDEWHRRYRKKLLLWATPGAQQGNAVLFDMRMSARGSRQRLEDFTEEAMETARLINEEGGGFTHDGHAALRKHVRQAKERPNQWGHTLGKVTRDSTKLVDLAVCMVGARLGRRRVLNSTKYRKGTRSGKVVVMR